MKNLLLLAACVLLFALSSAAQNIRKVDFAKKIAEATPESLPQVPPGKIGRTDARNENLKGSVKSVIEYTQEPGLSRKTDSEKYYDESGNLVRSVQYDDAGFPDTVTVWGYIDGKRVIRSADVKYAPGERPKPRHTIISVRAEDNIQNPNAPRDMRYSLQFTYAYDSMGRLIEERQYQNNGELWGGTRYKYDGNRRFTSHFDSIDQEITITIQTLDNNGNVIEQRWGVAHKDDNSRYIMTYIFDRNGNWIEQEAYDETIENGKPKRKLLWTTYRTITYYP